MINWDNIKENCTLEDFYNILCRNKPHHKSKLYNEWNNLESLVYEKLLNDEECPNECEKLIDEIINFLKKQKMEYTGQSGRKL